MTSLLMVWHLRGLTSSLMVSLSNKSPDIIIWNHASQEYWNAILTSMTTLVNKTPMVLLSLSGNVAFENSPSTQPLHTSSCSILIYGIPVTIYLSNLSAPWWIWPILLCHNSHISLFLLLITSAFRASNYNLFLLNPISFDFWCWCFRYTFCHRKYTY